MVHAVWCADHTTIIRRTVLLKSTILLLYYCHIASTPFRSNTSLAFALVRPCFLSLSRRLLAWLPGRFPHAATTSFPCLSSSESGIVSHWELFWSSVSQCVRSTRERFCSNFPSCPLQQTTRTRSATALSRWSFARGPDGGLISDEH